MTERYVWSKKPGVVSVKSWPWVPAYKLRAMAYSKEILEMEVWRLRKELDFCKREVSRTRRHIIALDPAAPNELDGSGWNEYLLPVSSAPEETPQ